MCHIRACVTSKSIICVALNSTTFFIASKKVIEVSLECPYAQTHRLTKLSVVNVPKLCKLSGDHISIEKVISTKQTNTKPIIFEVPFTLTSSKGVNEISMNDTSIEDGLLQADHLKDLVVPVLIDELDNRRLSNHHKDNIWLNRNLIVTCLVISTAVPIGSALIWGLRKLTIVGPVVPQEVN